MLITTIIDSFCEDRRGSINVKLWFLVLYVLCEVHYRSVVLDNVFLLTTITTHKGSQLLKLIEKRYQVQPSDKVLHTEHIALRNIILH